MTVQAGIEVETDLELLVGEMPAIPCEHSMHRVQLTQHEDAPATHYVQAICQCGPPSYAYAACPKFVELINSNSIIQCASCLTIQRTTDMFRVLAPINSSTR